MANKLEVLETKMGKKLLNFNGYLFRYERKGLGKDIWECQERRQSKCKARLHTTSQTDNMEILKEVGSHNHEPRAIKSEIRKFQMNICKDAKETHETPAQIISQNLGHLSAAAKGHLPMAHHLKRTVRRVRGQTIKHPPNPSRREDIKFPEIFQKTANGSNFILFDSGEKSDRILIFGTLANLEFLKNCDLWLCDGTFKVSPPLFDQVFVIHGLRNNSTAVPLLYCLTPNRLTTTYKRVLEAIKSLEPDLSPKQIMSDFEQPLLNAFKLGFPLAEQKGCFFHFTQSVLRKIRSLTDIFHLYSNDSDFALFLQHFMALALLPPECVVPAYEKLLDEEIYDNNEGIMGEFIAYFEKTWIGKLNRQGTRRIQPLYEISLWNCYHSILNDLPKTNNICEGFNRGISSLMGAAHPTIYKFIEGLKRRQSLAEAKIEQFYNCTTQQQQKSYITAKEQLKQIVIENDSVQYTLIERLRRLAYGIPQ